MKKINQFIYFREGKAPEGYTPFVSYSIKEKTDDYYRIYGNLMISRNNEGTDYIVEDAESEGYKNKNKHKKEDYE